MIVGSLLLILFAIALLVLGLAGGSSGLLISSIGASLLAAVALVVGARQAAAMRIDVEAADRVGFSPTASGRGPRRSPAAGVFTGPARNEPADLPPDHDPYRGPDRSTGPQPFGDRDEFSDRDAFGDRDDFGNRGDLGDRDAFGDRGDLGDRDVFSGRDPATRPDPFPDQDPFATTEALRRSDPFSADPGRFPDADRYPSTDPFTRPDPFVDSEPSPEISVPTQGGQPVEEADEPRWRHPAGPYRRSARAGEPLGEDGDEFAVVDIPPDEPDAQQVPAATAARVAALTTEVMVIDGRPRYHLAVCPHLVGRESEPLPVGEAVELGFTPCGRCEPDDHLLADSGRV